MIIYLISCSICFLGGVYVGVRWSEKLRGIYGSITGK